MTFLEDYLCVMFSVLFTIFFFWDIAREISLSAAASGALVSILVLFFHDSFKSYYDKFNNI